MCLKKIFKTIERLHTKGFLGDAKICIFNVQVSHPNSDSKKETSVPSIYCTYIYIYIYIGSKNTKTSISTQAEYHSKLHVAELLNIKRNPTIVSWFQAKVSFTIVQ